MTTSLRSTRFVRRRRRVSARLLLEPLERRQVRSGSTLPYAIGPEPGDTVDISLDLGRFDASGGAGVEGAIGDGLAGAADVDWYGFTLDRPARVVVSAGRRSESPPFRAVVGLYNNDPFAQDPYNPSGHRLLAEDVGGRSDDPAQVERVLAPGTYHVAVSGAGNRDFHPLLAASGLDGEVGDYDLRITTAAVEGVYGPAVLAAEPTPGAVLDRSPFAIRLALSGPIDPGTILPDETVRLIYNPQGTFGDEGDQLVPLGGVVFSTAASELQLFPIAPLAPGHYRVELAGESAEWRPVLTGPDAIPLGATFEQSGGRDYTLAFRIDGAEGVSGGGAADDTPVAANDLGDITDGALVRIEGAIGDDPYYDPIRVDDQDFPLNAANDVDMHRFRVRGEGRFALVAEVFAGRIGSPLDSGMSLFRIDPTDGSLHFIAGNNNSQNRTLGTDGSPWLLTDSILHAALTAGEYVLVVSSSFNTPSPLEDQPTDADGLFDPQRSHSGLNGLTTGPYVLGLRVFATPAPPRLVASNPLEGEVFDRPPTHLKVQFSEPVNVPLLASEAFRKSSQSVLPSVYIEGADGTRYSPRFESYDSATNTATFLMLDGLPAGSYTLHLSGRDGLAGYGGLALDGDGLGGDAVVHFQVDGPGRNLEVDESGGYVITHRPDTEESLDLGVLFAHELEAGITLVREADETPVGEGDRTEDYRFEVLQQAYYHFALYGEGLSEGLRMMLVDDEGNPVPFGSDDAGRGLFGILAPGTYRLRVEGREAAGLAYRVDLGLLGLTDNPPPLANGPAPSLQMRLNGLPGSTPTEPPIAPDLPDTTTPPGGTGRSGGPTPGPGSTPPESTPPDVASPPTPTPGDLAPTPTPGDFAPTPTPGDSGPIGGPTPGPGSTPEGGEAPASSPTPISPGGLIALSVSPIGSLHGNAEPFALASTQVSFTLPSQAPSVPSLAEAIAQMVIATQGPGAVDLADSGGPIDAGLGDEVRGPALVFAEGLRPVSATSQIPTGIADIVLNLEPTPAEPPPSRGAEEDAADELAWSDQDPFREEGGGEEAEDAAGEMRFATLAWNVGLASLVTALIVLIKRYLSYRTGHLVRSSSSRSEWRAGHPPEVTPGHAKPKGGRGRRSHLSRISTRGQSSLEIQGQFS